MMYDVTFRCGHTRMVNLIGQYEERQRKVLRYNNFLICPDCQASHASAHNKPSVSVWGGDADRMRPRY